MDPQELEELTPEELEELQEVIEQNESWRPDLLGEYRSGTMQKEFRSGSGIIKRNGESL